MHVFKLETRLKEYVNDHQEYENLMATWCLNKDMCKNALETVLINYPHYSVHNASHSETIISIIEMLLGERINELSPTDIWLILDAAYAHDLGMVITYERLKDEWNNPQFQEYLKALVSSDDADLANAANAILHIRDYTHDPTWPIELWHFVSLINADHFRARHAELSRIYLNDPSHNLGIDLGHHDLVKPRIIRILGRICEIHNEEREKILSLPYQTVGFSSDYAHPRFVAMLLRLGDLLDVDNGRFNKTYETVAGPLPASSRSHAEKHESTIHLLVTPREIQFSSDCPDEKAYLETSKFITMLEKEVDFLTKFWVKIVPENIGGYPPRFDKKELLLRGTPDIEGVAGLRFEISQAKAFQIIEGSNIYSDRFVFIREVIQNAMDASKIQLWRDLSLGTYNAWLKEANLESLQPYNLIPEIFENYKITVKILTLSDGKTQIEVADRGTGITIESFKAMCNVGVSNTASVSFLEEIKKMPCWLRPTAGFGVGLQSIFLLADQFEIDTCTGTDAYHAIVYSQRKGGYLHLCPVANSFARGTTIRIVFQKPKDFFYSMFGDTMRYISESFDFFDDEDRIGEMRVLEAIKRNCKTTMFPIQIQLSKNEIDSIDPIQIFYSNAQSKRFSEWQTRYCVGLTNENDYKTVEIWDKEKGAFAIFQLLQSDAGSVEFWFKGVDVNRNVPNVNWRGINCVVDIYGEDTARTITLDRTAFTSEGEETVRGIFYNLAGIYIEYMLEALVAATPEQKETILAPEVFNLYSFWCACNPQQRKRIPSDMIQLLKEQIQILQKGDTDKFELNTAGINTLIPNIYDYTFVNLWNFKNHGISNHKPQELIKGIINQMDDLDNVLIVVDERFTNAAMSYPIKSLLRCETIEPLFLLKFTRDIESAHTVFFSPNENTRRELLFGLRREIPGLSYRFLRTGVKAKRYGIPAFSEYSDLAVGQCPSGVIVPQVGITPYIIAPFDGQQVQNIDQMTKEMLVKSVTESKSFQRLVDYVYNDNYRKGVSSDRIRELYEKMIEEYYALKKSEEHS